MDFGFVSIVAQCLFWFQLCTLLVLFSVFRRNRVTACPLGLRVREIHRLG